MQIMHMLAHNTAPEMHDGLQTLVSTAVIRMEIAPRLCAAQWYGRSTPRSRCAGTQQALEMVDTDILPKLPRSLLKLRQIAHITALRGRPSDCVRCERWCV